MIGTQIRHINVPDFFGKPHDLKMEKLIISYSTECGSVFIISPTLKTNFHKSKGNAGSITHFFCI